MVSVCSKLFGRSCCYLKQKNNGRIYTCFCNHLNLYINGMVLKVCYSAN